MKVFTAVSSLLAVCCIASGILNAEPAETIFVNGNIYTVNDRQPHAEAIAIKGGRIVFVGSNAEAEKKFPPGGNRAGSISTDTRWYPG